MARQMMTDGLCSPAITMRPCDLVATVCILGGNDCPLLGKREAGRILEQVKSDPTAAIRLVSDAEELPHYTALAKSGYRCSIYGDSILD